ASGMIGLILENTPVRTHYGATDGKSKSSAGRLRGAKRIEHAIHDRRMNSNAVVANGYFDLPGGCGARADYDFIRVHLSQGQRLERVMDQIHQALLDLRSFQDTVG